MQTLDRDEVSTVVAARPEDVYALVADITLTPQFSPDVVSCRWLDDATGPAVGARFEAVNTTAARKPWRYRFEPVADGTRVTESYEVERPIGRIGWFVIERVFRAGDRRSALREGMRTTLERLRVRAGSSRG